MAARFPRHRRGFVVATIAAVLLALTGAFGTYAIGLVPRLAYWLLVMESGALIGMGVTTGMMAWGGLSRRPWVEGFAITLLIALPHTLVVIGSSIAFFNLGRIGLGTILVFFGFVWVITATVTAVNIAIEKPAAAPAPPGSLAAAEPAPPEPAAPLRPRLADRLPPHLRESPIVALQAEDHYLRVHTEAGSDLILLRLTDAMAELEGLDGARTHRSWWVARAAIRAVDRRDGRAELTLSGGITAPVSRSELPRLRDAGWFA
ncbi:LytTR family DNA-binding domain-containing protein [Sphingomonas sp. G-3-2-10]|uniref:LytTR family DNA-binding domain-containing protein n=1 Tax=Sphingomonas sp. G-3-2-10 TaxID=2728838 RepID=UPI00146D2302|nr:LytTR family DNA-binding domain-containing protein [Sphingomonas sp. G-3-2-10]NML06692.1 LytTR family transcriptional regulator [Sphingomonas sp. G-3-2-10]